MDAVDCKKVLPKVLICILILAVSLQSIGAALISTFSFSTDVSPHQYPSLNSTSSQQLVVDIYTESQGKGPNASIGAYTVGDQIKFYVYVNHNCSLRLELITPNNSVFLRMAGPESAGTFVDYVDAQYPIGTWKIVVVAEQGSKTVTETAPFRVIEKAPHTSTRANAFSNVTTIEEANFDGKVVQIYRYPVGGVAAWDVLVERIYFGPDIKNLTVKVQWLAVTSTLGYPPGYIDYSITSGDQVRVYGLVSQKGSDTSVTLNGSESYYIKKLSTLDKSPEIILFSRNVFPDNLSVRIEGIAIAGDTNASVTSVDWNWGDGQSSDQQFPATHTYTNVGTHVILIKATQSDGLSTTKSLSVSVSRNPFSPNPPTPESGLWAIASLMIVIGVVLTSIVAIRLRMKGSPRARGDDS